MHIYVANAMDMHWLGRDLSISGKSTSLAAFCERVFMDECMCVSAVFIICFVIRILVFHFFPSFVCIVRYVCMYMGVH